MSKNLLKIKRHSDDDDIIQDLNLSNLKNQLMNLENELDNSKNNSKSSGNFRNIIVLKNDKKITIKTDDINDFHNFVLCFNCLFYIMNGVKHYLIEKNSIEEFFQNSDFHILYDSENPNNIPEKAFNSIHNFPKRKNIKTTKDFCFFPEYTFSSEKHKYYYTSLWSPTRILKFYRLSDKNYPFMRDEFSMCSNSKITRFYGPKGTGKSTFVYVFFAITSKIEINLDKIDQRILAQKDIRIKDLKLKPQSKICIEEFTNISKSIYEVKENINGNEEDNESNESKENILNNNNKTLNLIEEEEDENKLNEKELLENIHYIKEFKSGKKNEDYYFLSSVYIDLDKERNPIKSEKNKMFFEIELMHLFKTFKFYQYLLIYLNGDKKPNIFDRIKQIIQFMIDIKNNRNYFIILDHISEKEQESIIDIEKFSEKDPRCFILELPLIIARQEKLNLLKDLYINSQERLESFDSKDKISYIKRNKKYGIIYSTNYYSPEIIDEEDKVFEENFGKNIYFYCLWKYSKNKIKINDYIQQISEQISQIFKENYNNDQNELVFNIRTILDLIENKKEISNTDFLSRLPLEYFILINNNNKFLLQYSFPIIGKIIKKLNISSSLQLLKSRYFISYFDNFIKGGIMEKVFMEKIEDFYNKKIKSKMEVINIDRLLDNKIRDYFSYEEEKRILNKNNNFIQIYQKSQNNLKNKNIIFKQVQNAKHYDFGIKIFNKKNHYILGQISYHKSNEDLKEFINSLFIDINYIINKVNYLCNEDTTQIDGIYLYFILMDLESYNIPNLTEKEREIIKQNKYNNLNVIKKLTNFHIDFLYLDSQGNIKQNNKNIEMIPLRFNLLKEFKIKIKELRDNKKDLERKCMENLRKIFENKKLTLQYYTPYHKNEKGYIMAHLFTNNSLNYYEIEGEKENQYYNMIGGKLDNNLIFKIEKENSKNWKMNVLVKIS